MDYDKLFSFILGVTEKVVTGIGTIVTNVYEGKTKLFLATSGQTEKVQTQQNNQVFTIALAGIAIVLVVVLVKK